MKLFYLFLVVCYCCCCCLAQRVSDNFHLSYSAPNGHFVNEDRSVDGTSVLGNFGYQTNDGRSVGVSYGNDGAGFVIGSAPSVIAIPDAAPAVSMARSRPQTPSGPLDDIIPDAVTRSRPRTPSPQSAPRIPASPIFPPFSPLVDPPVSSEPHREPSAAPVISSILGGTPVAVTRSRSRGPSATPIFPPLTPLESTPSHVPRSHSQGAPSGPLESMSSHVPHSRSRGPPSGPPLESSPVVVTRSQPRIPRPVSDLPVFPADSYPAIPVSPAASVSVIDDIISQLDARQSNQQQQQQHQEQQPQRKQKRRKTRKPRVQSQQAQAIHHF